MDVQKLRGTGAIMKEILAKEFLRRDAFPERLFPKKEIMSTMG